MRSASSLHSLGAFPQEEPQSVPLRLDPLACASMIDIVPQGIPMRALVVACLPQLATVATSTVLPGSVCSAFDGSGESQRGRQARRVICSVNPVGHVVGPDVDA